MVLAHGRCAGEVRLRPEARLPVTPCMLAGQRAVRALRRMLLEGASPCSAFVKLPCHLPVERVNTEASAARPLPAVQYSTSAVPAFRVLDRIGDETN